MASAPPQPAAWASLTALADRLAGAMQPDLIAPAIVRCVAKATRAASVDLWIKRLDADALELSAHVESDQPEPDGLVTTAFALNYDGEGVGQLDVTLPATRRLSAAARAKVAAFCGRIGPAIQIVRMTLDLRRAREHLVLTREEERRRLRRQLHNTIGPTLAALDLRAGAVRAAIGRDPDEAAQQMTELRTMLRSVIRDIRRVVYDLRPPALDELGLLPAIREQARQFSADGINVNVDAPESLMALPAAVEVAAYRIILEGLSNIARHSHATEAMITLRQDPLGLSVSVQDNGIGLGEGFRVGVGVSAMRELASELGGSCSIAAGARAGTQIDARLPLYLDSPRAPAAQP